MSKEQPNLKVRITEHLRIYRPLDGGNGGSLAIPLDKDDLRKVIDSLTKILNQE